MGGVRLPQYGIPFRLEGGFQSCASTNSRVQCGVPDYHSFQSVEFWGFRAGGGIRQKTLADPVIGCGGRGSSPETASVAPLHSPSKKNSTFNCFPPLQPERSVVQSAHLHPEKDMPCEQQNRRNQYPRKSSSHGGKTRKNGLTRSLKRNFSKTLR